MADPTRPETQIADVLAAHALVWDDLAGEWFCGATAAVCGWHRRVPREWRDESANAHRKHVAAVLTEEVVRQAERDAAAEALREAADEMEAVIAEGDVAEVAAYVPGEVGRAAVVAKRDALYEEPVEWLREYAAARAAASETTEAER